MGSLWESKTYLKNPNSPLNGFYVLWRFRSFHRGIVSLIRSKGCKFVVCQTLKMIWLSRTRTWAAFIWLESGRATGFFSDLQLWQLIVLQSFDLQGPAIPLWKDLILEIFGELSPWFRWPCMMNKKFSKICQHAMHLLDSLNHLLQIIHISPFFRWWSFYV